MVLLGSWFPRRSSKESIDETISVKCSIYSKEIECEDPDRPIETYPRYLGLWFDGSLSCAPELARLERTDIQKYLRLVDEVGETRCLELRLPFGLVTIEVTGDEGMHGILEQLKTIDVYLDNGPGDWGPASGAFWCSSLPTASRRRK